MNRKVLEEAGETYTFQDVGTSEVCFQIEYNWSLLFIMSLLKNSMRPIKNWTWMNSSVGTITRRKMLFADWLKTYIN